MAVTLEQIYSKASKFLHYTKGFSATRVANVLSTGRRHFGCARVQQDGSEIIR